MSGDSDKVNAVNYLTKPPPSVDEYYYEEDVYAINDQNWGFQQNAKALIRKICTKVKETKVKIIVTTTESFNMFEMRSTAAKSALTRITMVTCMIRVGLVFFNKIGKFLPRKIEVVWRELRIRYRR